MDHILNFFISSAYAQDSTATAATAQQSGTSTFIMLGVVIVLSYFLMLRPQNKRAKEQQNLINSLAKGDEIVTSGGLLGKITRIKDNYLAITLANNVEIMVQKASVVSLLPKGTLKSLE